MEGYKTCPQCGEMQPVDNFHKNRSKKDGLSVQCKVCKKVNKRAYREANRERIAAKDRAYYDANRERIAAKDRVRNRDYFKANRERIKVKSRAYYEENRGKVKARVAAYREANPQIGKATNSRRRARKARNGVYLNLDKELKRLYASPCVACGTTENIEKDHIIPIARGGQDSIGNAQPLCRSCNASKGDKLMIEWRVWREQLAGSSVGAA